MAVNRILFWFGRTLLLCTVLYSLAAILALVSQDVSGALVMACLGIPVGVFGLLFVMLSSASNTLESKAEIIVFLVLFWITVPAVLAMPFQVMGVSPDLLSAYFESVSAFTTTGATRLVPDGLSRVMLFWRSLLQWAGGVSVATFAIVVLAAVNQTGTGVHRSILFTIKKGELFSRLLAVGRLVAGVYLMISVIGFTLMALGGAPTFEALCLALSGVSTGGLTPRAVPLQVYVPPFAAMVLAVVCVLGAMNIAIIWDFLRRRKIRDALRLAASAEHRALFVLIGILVIIALMFSDLGHSFDVILDSAFFASSAGFQYQVISLDMIPPAILITVALIGGCALSTAGGVKLIRMLLLFRHLSTELSRLSHPSRVVPIKFRSQTIPDAAFLSIWMYFFAYTLAFGIGISLMGIVGLPLDDAIASTAAGLSNVGPLLDLTLPESGLTYAHFTQGQMVVYILMMILGRIEVLAAIALFMPNFWRQ